jgi:hypothetical protein
MTGRSVGIWTVGGRAGFNMIAPGAAAPHAGSLIGGTAFYKVQRKGARSRFSERRAMSCRSGIEGAGLSFKPRQLAVRPTVPRAARRRVSRS